MKTTTLAPESGAGKSRPRVIIPKTGVSPDELREEMKLLQNKEANAERDGNIFALTYTVNDENYKLQKEAFDSFEGEYLLHCDLRFHTFENLCIVHSASP